MNPKTELKLLWQFFRWGLQREIENDVIPPLVFALGVVLLGFLAIADSKPFLGFVVMVALLVYVGSMVRIGKTRGPPGSRPWGDGL